MKNVVLILCCCFIHVVSLSLKEPTKVVIVGASTPVGLSVFQKLQKRKGFFPVGLVKDKNAYNNMMSRGIPSHQLKVADITQKKALSGLLDNAEKVVVCTSATPRRKWSSRINELFCRLIGVHYNTSATSYYYDKAYRPYELDYIGQRNVVDECVRAKVQHVVLLGKMGGKKYYNSPSISVYIYILINNLYLRC